jgi:MFS transporter, ACS family, allantoate permease
MIPIVFALVPTIIGSGMLVGINNTGNKGALLFGEAFAAII